MNPDGVTDTDEGFSEMKPFFIVAICIGFDIYKIQGVDSIKIDTFFGDKPVHIEISAQWESEEPPTI